MNNPRLRNNAGDNLGKQQTRILQPLKGGVQQSTSGLTLKPSQININKNTTQRFKPNYYGNPSRF